MSHPFTPRPFRPAWWLPGGHLQTLGGKYLRNPPSLPLRRHRLDTPDGDFVDVDFGPGANDGGLAHGSSGADPRAGSSSNPAFGPGLRDDAPLVLILHGLEGFSRRPYVLHAMAALAARGVASACLNFRSCSGEPNRVPRMYHSGETEDAELVLRFLRERWPHRSLGALGFSLGGNVLLKLMGEREDGGLGLLGAAVAISVPYDLDAGSTYLERGPLGLRYSRYFVDSLKRKVRAKEHLLAPLLDLEAVYRARTIREFDERATAPLHGFRDATDYYRRSSSGGYLEGIRVPTLLIHAHDDPFLPPASIPYGIQDRNPALTAAFVRSGGHVGFVSGTAPGRPRFWAEEEAGRFLAGRLGA
jgi:uncharacterized protein